jgi:hypothetical protein
LGNADAADPLDARKLFLSPVKARMVAFLLMPTDPLE